MSTVIAEPPGYRGRFAPSPTGPLHLGSLTAALGSWLLARHRGGEWLVRVEDLDPARELPGMADQQIRTLAAFGMVSDAPVLWQSQRSEHYAAALDQLIGQGLAFECRCSRSDLALTGGVHRQCVAHPSGSRAAWRLRIGNSNLAFEDAIRGRFEQSLADEVGDMVLRRADGYWAYQLAAVVDDSSQGITDVVRGADLIDSTPRQILLQQMLGLPTPRYAHLPLIRQPDGLKLSKSLSATPVDASNPLPALRLAYAWLGQEADVIGLDGSAERALLRALSRFEPGRIPAQDHVLVIE